MAKKGAGKKRINFALKSENYLFSVNFYKFFVFGAIFIAYNGLQLGEVADFEALTFILAQMFI